MKPLLPYMILCAASITASSAGAVADIPRLAPGAHLSVLPAGYFEPVEPGTEAALEAALADAVAAGMFTVAYELDWNEIEVSPGVYDLETFTARLDDWAAAGLTAPYLNISCISIGSLGAPADLVDPDDPTAFAGGRRVDDPVIVGRYLAMLDAVLPGYLARGGWVVMVGNEVDVYFEEDPGAGFEFARFVAAVRDHVHATYPDLPVGVVLTKGASAGPPAWYEPVRAASDVAGWNYYAQNPDFSVMTDPHAIRAEIARLYELSGDLPVLIQELGCPTGPQGGVLGADEALQATVASVMLDEVLGREQTRWVSWFKMVSFSSLFAEAYRDLILDQEPDAAAWLDGFVESLEGYGLLDRETGRPKAAWRTFLATLVRLYAYPGAPGAVTPPEATR